jgi:hypothetical protein
MKAPDPNKISGQRSSARGSAPTAPPTGEAHTPALEVTAPGDWTETPPKHSFFLKTWDLPGGGIANISYLGPNESTINDNLSRWVGQWTNADGTPVEKVEQFSLDDAGMETMLIMLEGTLASTAQLGGGPARTDWMLIGAVVTSSQGPLYVKALGPKDSLHAQMGEVQKMLREMTAK